MVPLEGSLTTGRADWQKPMLTEHPKGHGPSNYQHPYRNHRHQHSATLTLREQFSMTALFIHQGDAIDHVPTTDLDAGTVVVQGALVGITTRSIPAGHLGALQLRGVFDVARLVGGIIAPGTRLFWDEGNQHATTDDNAGANAYLGKAVRESGDTDDMARVRLEQ